MWFYKLQPNELNLPIQTDFEIILFLVTLSFMLVTDTQKTGNYYSHKMFFFFKITKDLNMFNQLASTPADVKSFNSSQIFISHMSDRSKC